MSNVHSQEPAISQIRRQSTSSVSSDDERDFTDDEDDPLNSSASGLTATPEESPKNRKKNKKTLGRVKIDMAYITNKIRRYTTFSKRKTGIMKKAYELATLTGTEVMLLVASETGHVYTYATAKLQPMITSETGKALIQTCLAKDEPVIESVVDTPTTLNNNDVIFVDENQRKKRTSTSMDTPGADTSSGNRPIKRAKLKSSNDAPSAQPMRSSDSSSARIFLAPSPSVSRPATTTVALPLSCFVNPDPQQQTQQQVAVSPPFMLDSNALKMHGMNIIFAPSSSASSSSQPSPSPSVPLILTLGNFPYPPTQQG